MTAGGGQGSEAVLKSTSRYRRLYELHRADELIARLRRRALRRARYEVEAGERQWEVRDPDGSDGPTLVVDRSDGRELARLLEPHVGRGRRLEVVDRSLRPSADLAWRRIGGNKWAFIEPKGQPLLDFRRAGTSMVEVRPGKEPWPRAEDPKGSELLATVLGCALLARAQEKSAPSQDVSGFDVSVHYGGG